MNQTLQNISSKTQSQCTCCCSCVITLGIALFIYFALAYFAYSKTKKITKYYKNVYPHLQNYPSEWKGFIRQDKHQWDERQIMLGCFFRFPFKVVMFFQYVLGCFFIILITLPLGSKVCNKILKYYGRYYGTYVFKMIWNITEPQNIKKRVLKTPIVISNHVCWIDTMYLIVTFYPISFLSKEQVSKIPIFGRITTNAQSIYIQRDSEQARQSIVNSIKQRVERFMQQAKQGIYQKIYPLIIFPQGTTSNADTLLKFKLGAFNDLAPLTIVSLKYTSPNFDVGMVEITQAEHILLSFCLKINLDVKIDQIEAKKNQTPQEYCQRAQNKLKQMGGYSIFKVGYRQKKQQEKIVQEKIKSSKDKKQQ